VNGADSDCLLPTYGHLMYKLISKIFDRLERGLSPREKVIIISLMLVISVLGIVLAVRYYNYIQKNPEFCNSCHLMEEAYRAWKLDPVEDLHKVPLGRGCAGFAHGEQIDGACPPRIHGKTILQRLP